jgi:hypothetical protein
MNYKLHYMYGICIIILPHCNPISRIILSFVPKFYARFNIVSSKTVLIVMFSADVDPSLAL